MGLEAMKGKRRAGRPPKLPSERRDIQKKLYIDDKLNERFLLLFMESEATSESSFIAELIRLGMAVKSRQLAGTQAIVESTA